MSDKELAKASETELNLTTKGGELVNLDYGAYSNQGTENADEGARVPFLSVLQPLSKALQEGHENFIDGAKAGMFAIDGRVFSGKTGVMFVPIAEEHKLVEITSIDGNGEVKGIHDPHGPVAAAARAKYGNKKGEWRSDAGHMLVERFNIYGVVCENQEALEAGQYVPCIAGFERTKLKARESFMAPLRKLKGNRPPLFAMMIRLTTKLEKGKKGDYYDLVASFENNGDFASSLLPPNTEFFRRWAPEASAIAEEIKAGNIKGDENGANENTNEDGVIPF